MTLGRIVARKKNEAERSPAGQSVCSWKNRPGASGAIIGAAAEAQALRTAYTLT